MIGLVIIIIISWGLLYFIEKKSIEVLGVIPYPNRIVQFLVGIVFITLTVLLIIFIESIILKVNWQLNGEINYASIFDAFIYHLRSALTEDLIFRGALLYILIKKLGAKWGMLISAIGFGVYHLFSYGMIGSNNIVPILYVVLVTGFTGFVWAYTFYKTKSMMLALGFHLGYNLIMTFFYPSQPYGELLFTELSKIELSEWNKLYYSLFKGFFPSIITLAFVKLLFYFKLKLVQP